MIMLLSTKTRDEWLAHFKAQKATGFLCVAIKEVSELTNDPQLLANNYIVEDEHPTLGHMRMVQFPMEFSKTPVVPGGKATPQLVSILKISYWNLSIAGKR